MPLPRPPSNRREQPEHPPSAPAAPAPSPLHQERRRIAQVLHDTVCQELTGIALLAAATAHQCRASSPDLAQRIEEIADLTQQAGAHLGRIMHALHAGGEGEGPPGDPPQA